ncbi:MAG TPA: lipid IV(A) 3-deoxy-D-manno-octulosonic acid transferase [Xanthomonadales bacterium]|nr:lipid IV(A) 3-deoxy-D-manno-octulosonic acid transferase [Xanthomonadales bacterium]
MYSDSRFLKAIPNVRTLYLLASYLLMPLLLLRLAVRGLRDRDYLKRWSERFALHGPAVPPGGIVVHAASLGEVNAAAPLIRALRIRFPDLPLTVTCFTPTGSARIRALFAADVCHVYSPLDLYGAVRRFLSRARPCLLLVMETEIWPNLFFAAGQRGIPLLLANARISDKSFRVYRRLRPLVREALAEVSGFMARSETDARRLAELGAAAGRIEVTGNLKFDLDVPDGLHEHGLALRRSWGLQRPVLLAGSTHQEDEVALIEAFKGLLGGFPTALLVLVPRHPERFQLAAQLVRAAGLSVQMQSAGADCPASTQCLVVDAMGELLRCYAACDVAFVGGSLAPVGGHNLLEPAALSVPVLFGPHTSNAADITAQLLAAGAAQVVRDAAELEQAAARLLGDEALRQSMGAAGLALVQSGRGALGRTLQIAAGLLVRPLA